MFDLARDSLFFSEFEKNSPNVVQNIESILDNKHLLDSWYHQPKMFALGLNNLLRSIIGFIEFSTKNSPGWLRECANSFRVSEEKNLALLKKLRDVSLHQQLVFPKESLVSGLFRVRSAADYKLKFGFGDHEGPNTYAWDYAFRNTSEIFDDQVLLLGLMFMDLEHSALGECLGVTRRWFVNLNVSGNGAEPVDVYELLTGFSLRYVDHVCHAYSKKDGLSLKSPTFVLKVGQYNSINTLLELDIYPSLFRSWWEEAEMTPLNMGVRSSLHGADTVNFADDFYQHVFENLTASPAEYRSRLVSLSNISMEQLETSDGYTDFTTFFLVNYWHFKRAFRRQSYDDEPLEGGDILHLQRLARIVLGELRKETICTIQQSLDSLILHVKVVIEKLDVWSTAKND